MNKARVLIATVVATALGFGIHVLYGQGLVMEYVQQAGQEGRLNDFIRQPYPTWFVIVAAITALIPTLGKVLLYVFIQEKLLVNSRTGRGLLYGFILLAIDDALLRMPIMSVAGNNPVDVMLIQSAEGWIIPLVIGVVIAHLVPSGASHQNS